MGAARPIYSTAGFRAGKVLFTTDLPEISPHFPSQPSAYRLPCPWKCIDQWVRSLRCSLRVPFGAWRPAPQPWSPGIRADSPSILPDKKLDAISERDLTHNRLLQGLNPHGVSAEFLDKWKGFNSQDEEGKEEERTRRAKEDGYDDFMSTPSFQKALSTGRGPSSAHQFAGWEPVGCSGHFP